MALRRFEIEQRTKDGFTTHRRIHTNRLARARKEFEQLAGANGDSDLTSLCRRGLFGTKLLGVQRGPKKGDN